MGKGVGVWLGPAVRLWYRFHFLSSMLTAGERVSKWSFQQKLLLSFHPASPDIPRTLQLWPQRRGGAMRCRKSSNREESVACWVVSVMWAIFVWSLLIQPVPAFSEMSLLLKPIKVYIIGLVHIKDIMGQICLHAWPLTKYCGPFYWHNLFY